MRVSVIPADTGTGCQDLLLGGIRYSSFSEHDLRDIAAALTDRFASRTRERCAQENGQHTCGLSVSHQDARNVTHMCRACDVLWDADGVLRRTALGTA